MEFLIRKIIYTFYYMMILLVRKYRRDEINDSGMAIKFVKLNNLYVLKKALKYGVRREEVAILLPHCIQNYDCAYKVTGTIENCRECGKCSLDQIKKIQKKYGVQVKVATGGTLARRFLKEVKPKLVIAVACERDLVSGIYDAFPLLCYGIFNVRKNGPCINTDFPIEELQIVLEKLGN